LAHANIPTIIYMAKKKMATGMPIDLSQIPSSCEHCIRAKQTKNSVPKKCQGPKSNRKLVYIDLTGPEAVQSATGNLYSMELVDEHTDRIWAIPLRYKSHALPKLR
ncbi:hypothetical protein B0H10DRAFT_1767346, partial [Mycena sp. CBHHK59/15]